jgi:glucose dehydrogenase
VWPLAAVDALSGDDDATNWSRLHSRQALVWGIFATIGYVVLMGLPLVVVIAVPGISTGATVWLYAIGLIADVVGAGWLFAVGSRFARRARRGELFAVPLVTPIVDRFFRPRS